MSDSHNPPRIAVLSGGVGPERDVSINSGSALADALESFYPVDLIDVKERKLPRDLDPERHVVFSIIHGTFGEDGSLQVMLEEGGFSYAGCDSASSRLCMHKGNCKDKVRENGVRTVSDFRFQNPREVSASSVIERLGTELVVKPADQGSSVALHICSGEEELERALDQLPDGSWMIEKRIVGREVTIGLLQGEPLGIVEVVPEGGVYDYTRKYSAGKTEYRFPAVLDLDLEQEVRSMAKHAYDSCDCRDFARVDFMISEDGIVYFLEINTLPGLTTTSLFPKSASCSGYDFSRLSQKLLEGAMTRYKASPSILQQT